MVISAVPHGGRARADIRGWPILEGFAPTNTSMVLEGGPGVSESRYGDPSWRYGQRSQGCNTPAVTFDVEKDDLPQERLTALLDEARWLLYLYLFGRPNKKFAAATAYHNSRVVLAMVEFCAKNGLELRDIFGSFIIGFEFLSQTGSATPKAFMSLMQALREMGVKRTGFTCMEEEEQAELRKFKKNVDDIIKQHPPVPTKIYANLIEGLERDIDEYQKVESEIHALVRNIIEDDCFGRSRRRQEADARAIESSDDELQIPDGLSEILSVELEHYLAKRGIDLNVYGLMSAVSEMQIVCKISIHVFSGMRDEEANFLPYDCYQSTVLDNRTFHILTGHTTKFSNGIPTGVFWVTSNQGVRALELARRISELVKIAQDKNFPGEDKGKLRPLFLSTGYFQLNKPQARPKVANQPGTNQLFRFRQILDRYDMVITKEDIAELKRIDPNRSWHTEDDFRIGKRWPLRTHQLRRSLALYATSSGLVGITSLRRQLHHIRAAMSQYYARGSVFAKNILETNPEHMARIYQTSEIEAAFLGFLKNLVESNEPSFGAFGTWVERNIKERDGTITLETRADVKRRFARGEISYTDTIYGGCGKTGPCDKRSMRSIVACIGCDASAIKRSRLDIVIDQQSKLLSDTPAKTIEFKTEEGILVDLMAYREKISKKKG
jgi:hypothetical protein